ncbi:MAG TPA: flavodoxin family protein [Clostridia bacterium]|nr:flavodoxin family protein [Clostridia bacterium]
MKILAVIASPLGRGNTYKTVKAVESRLQAVDKTVEFEYLILKDMDFQLCRGCFQCLARGEKYCPIRDERALVEEKLNGCDGFIFASPVYNYNMSWMAKNFSDRFAYISHRPRFHGKKAMVVATTGGVGLSFTLFTLKFPLMIWGFEVAAKLGIACSPGRFSEEQLREMERKKEKAVLKAADKFYNSLSGKKKPRPGIISVFGFLIQKVSFASAGKDNVDYLYWKGKGWFDPEVYYYCDASIGPVKRFAAWLASRIALAGMFRPETDKDEAAGRRQA